MRITRLALRDFRNHQATILELDARHVCLAGDNGAGKTNILEAVSMLGPGKGIRGAALPTMTRTNGQDEDVGGWALSARLDDDGVERRILVALEASGEGRSKRVTKLDDVAVGQTELAQLLRVVWLTPAMDRVFGGPAGERRKFFDRQVLAHAPSHGKDASIYEKAMRERNALMEQGRVEPVWLDALEDKLAEAGAAMADNRARALARLQAAINARPEGYFPKADLFLDGQFEALCTEGKSRAEVADAIREVLRQNRPRDAAAGRVLAGVHRSDLKVFHRPKSLAAEQCSTGEQKALLIGLILANARALLEGDFAPNPVLLLDEAAAHLDSDRRAALYDELAALGGQGLADGYGHVLVR